MKIILLYYKHITLYMLLLLIAIKQYVLSIIFFNNIHTIQMEKVYNYYLCNSIYTDFVISVKPDTFLSSYQHLLIGHTKKHSYFYLLTEVIINYINLPCLSASVFRHYLLRESPVSSLSPPTTGPPHCLVFHLLTTL